MPTCVAILPAAGSGSRFGSALPKQFTLLGQDMLLVHTLRALLQEPRIGRIHVVLEPEHQHLIPWSQWQGRVQPCPGAGASRAETVRNAVEHLLQHYPADTWVVVHDAARPCVSASALARLLDALWNDPVGGLLAIPVADTLKRQQQTLRVLTTVDRSGLWAAQTPQMFPLQLLADALQRVPRIEQVTDEASAIEAMGLQPLLVMGESTNIKVTYPADQLLAQWLLLQGQSEMTRVPDLAYEGTLSNPSSRDGRHNRD